MKNIRKNGTMQVNRIMWRNEALDEEDRKRLSCITEALKQAVPAAKTKQKQKVAQDMMWMVSKLTRMLSVSRRNPFLREQVEKWNERHKWNLHEEEKLALIEDVVNALLRSDGMNENLVGSNTDKPIQEVEHEKLERYSETSPYKSVCPVCKEGVLMMGRNLETLVLQEHDFCILCGQQFRYTDIDKLREAECPS